jgi:hypothetical protein
MRWLLLAFVAGGGARTTSVRSLVSATGAASRGYHRAPRGGRFFITLATLREGGQWAGWADWAPRGGRFFNTPATLREGGQWAGWADWAPRGGRFFNTLATLREGGSGRSVWALTRLAR